MWFSETRRASILGETTGTFASEYLFKRFVQGCRGEVSFLAFAVLFLGLPSPTQSLPSTIISEEKPYCVMGHKASIHLNAHDSVASHADVLRRLRTSAWEASMAVTWPSERTMKKNQCAYLNDMVKGAFIPKGIDS